MKIISLLLHLIWLYSLYRGQAVKDSLVYIGEFQPHSEDFNPIRGDEIMESFIFQHSLDSISSVKKYHIGQVTESSDELIEEMNVTLVRHIRLVSFCAKPWRYAWNEDKIKEKEIMHSFVISILQPYSHPAHVGSCCLKVIEQFQSSFFQVSSQRRGKSSNLIKTDKTTAIMKEFRPSIENMADDDDDDDDYSDQQEDKDQQQQSQLSIQQQQRQLVIEQHQQHLQKLTLQKQRRQQILRDRRQQQLLEQQQQQQELNMHISTVPAVQVSNIQSSSNNLSNLAGIMTTGASPHSDKKSLKFCHSFSDGTNNSSNAIIDNSFDENVFDNLEILRNVSFRMMRHSDSACDIFLSDPLFPLVENLDYMDISDEDENDVKNVVVDNNDADVCIVYDDNDDDDVGLKRII